jgi:hypothetical protein
MREGLGQLHLGQVDGFACGGDAAAEGFEKAGLLLVHGAGEDTHGESLLHGSPCLLR